MAFDCQANWQKSLTHIVFERRQRQAYAKHQFDEARFAELERKAGDLSPL